MSVLEIWRSNLIVYILLVFVGFIFFTFDNVILFIILGGLLLLGAMFMSYQNGQGAGHAACSVSNSLERVNALGESTEKVDGKLLRQAWRKGNAIRIVLAGGAGGYIINCLYIVLSLLNAGDIPEVFSRIASFVVTIPFWPILAYWHETFMDLTPDVIVLLMASPFLLPACQAAGYLQGPALWAKTEKAMVDGKRRAKARSRIVRKKKTPRSAKPEI